jgi:hypothetical protein
MRTAEEYLQQNNVFGMVDLIVPIMKQYASEACKEQREICAEEYTYAAPYTMAKIELSIKNAPEPTLS